MTRQGCRQVWPRHTASNSVGRLATVELPCPVQRTLFDQQNRNMHRGEPCPSLGEKHNSEICPQFRSPVRAEANLVHLPPAFRREGYTVHRLVGESPDVFSLSTLAS